TAAALALDITAVADALQALEPLLAYQLVVGRVGAAESWQGARRRDRERVVVWGEPLADGEVALLDAQGRVVSKLSPLVQVVSPLPSAEPELFLLWRSGRGAARLVAAPWGFERDDEAAAARLSLLTTEDADTLANEGDDSSPYPGLAAYGVDDAARFVGREREIESLANRLVRAPMVAVLGPSGAGKSSFIHAGLLPRLAENYEIITMRPGRHPLHALAALPPVNGDTEDAAAISERLRALGERAPRGLVIVIDQLEELVTLCADPAERERFAATLAAAADGRSAPVRVVVTLRDDFASIIEAVEAFRGRFEVFVLATPPPEALRRIVTEPARRAGVTVDVRVVEDMVAEVAGRPASLPLLSFTASQLWATRDRQARKITHDAYVALGGVAGALTTYADTVYESLARRDQDVVRDLFSRLVSADGTRIPAPRAELEQIAGAAGVLAHLIDARLLVVREDDGIDVVEIVHECLATRWDRLARWRSEDAADRALLGDVRAAARRWREAGQRVDLLWRGEALAELRKLTTRSTALTETERAFAAEADRAERRSRKVRRALVITAMGMLGAVAIVMAYLGLAANRSRAAAERSAGEAQIAAQLAEDRLTASLIAQGRRELNDGRSLPALAYFGEAMRRGADSPALRFMLSIAGRGWRYQLVSRHDSMISAVASSAKGTWIATADQTAHIQFWNTDGTQRAQLGTELGWISSLTRTPDDRVLAVGRDGIAIVEPGAPRIVQRLRPTAVAMTANAGPATDEITVFEEDAIRVYGLDGKVRRSLAITSRQASAIPIFDPTGRYVSLTDGDVVSFDVVKMTSRVLARDIEGVLGGTADGRLIGYVDKERLAHVLTGDGKELRTFKPEVAGHSLIFSDDGERVGVLSEHDLVIHDANGKWLHGMLVKPTIAQYVVRGDETWIAGADGVLLHYREGQLVASIPHHHGDTRTLHVVGNLALTVGDNGSLAISRADAAQLELVPRPCKRAAFSGDGIAVTYTCGKEHHVYVGRRHIGTVHGTGFGFVAVDVVSGRGAVSERELTVFEATKPVAKATEPAGHLGSLGFEDRDHLLVAEPEERFGVWRWTIGTERWDHVIALAGSVAVAVGTGGIFVGTLDGDVVRVRDGREVSRVAVGARVTFLVASGDRRWLAATLVDGTTAILDGETGALVRRLEPADALVTAAVLDHHGDLLIRSGRGTMTVWDRATGEVLVFALDLLGDMTGAAWSQDGRIELAGRQIGILDIKRDVRPAAAIVEDIACRVAVRVREGKLEPAPPACPPPAR
ncbi:MAG: hypothetical protein H0T89_17445, partial [Deltaproteobacteria bacterium]|nr:hypothetical protein [Deltaproteobacteria bacterium]